MQHRDVADRGRLIICRVRPGIGSVGLGVAMQLKNFYNPVPDGLTVESLCDWNAFEVAGFHAAQRVMRLYEVVVGEMKANGCFEVLSLFAECQSQPSQTTHMKASRGVEPLDIAGGDQIDCRLARNDHLLGRDKFRRAVASMIFDCFSTVDFDDLPVVGIAAKSLFDSLNISFEAVGRDLDRSEEHT